jgi:hypothetical protein
MDMPQDPVEARGELERDGSVPRVSRRRRTLVLVLVSLGLVSGGAVISATAAGAASGASQTAATEGSSSDSSAEQAQSEEGQDEGQGEGQRDCPEKEEAEEAA